MVHPSSVKKKEKSHANLLQAIEDVKTKRLTTLQACVKYNIPKSTLYDKLSGISPIFTKKGPSCILSDKHEAILAKWILRCGSAGFPVTKEQVLLSVARLVSELGLSTPFTDNKPGRKWYKAFLQRHPEISERTPQNLTLSRASVTEAKIRNWFAVVQKSLTEGNNFLVDQVDQDDPDDPADDVLDQPEATEGSEQGAADFKILEDPQRIFNADEAAFFYNPKGETVLFKQGAKSVHRVINVDEKECVTILVTVSAAGAQVPPMAVLKYKRIPEKIAQAIPKKWAIGNSESGWMTSETFYEYIANIFEPWLTENNILRPVIIFVDCHVSHITFHLSQLCREKKIILVALPSNSTHLIQPLDVACFRALKLKWAQVAADFRIQNMQPIISKSDFFPLLNKAMDEGLSEKTIKSGFRKCGLSPWDPNAVDYSKLKNGADAGEIVETTESTPASDGKCPAKWKTIMDDLNEFLGADKLEFFVSIKNTSNWYEILDVEDTRLFIYWRRVVDNAKEETEAIVASSPARMEQVATKNLSPLPASSAPVELNETISSVSTRNLHLAETPGSDEGTEISSHDLETEILTLNDLIDYDAVLPLEAFELNDNPLEDLSSSFITTATSPAQSIGTSSSIITALTCLTQSTSTTASSSAVTAPTSSVQDSTASSSTITASTSVQSMTASTSYALNITTSTSAFAALTSSAPSNTASPSAITASKSSSPVASTSAASTSNVQTASAANKKTPRSTQPDKAPAISVSRSISSGSSAPPVTSVAKSTLSGKQKSKSESPNIPSPFKRALPWPEKDKVRKKSNRKLDFEFIPVVSSQKWQDFYEKQRKEKEEIEAAKEQKKQERERKKKEKEEVSIRKANSKQPSKKRKPALQKKSVSLEELNSDQEDEMGSIKSTLKVGDHVIVEYEEEFFPGVVSKREADAASVKTMAIAGIDVWKWPLKEDVCLYEYSDIKMIIKPPTSFNNRGHFKVPEIKNFR